MILLLSRRQTQINALLNLRSIPYVTSRCRQQVEIIANEERNKKIADKVDGCQAVTESRSRRANVHRSRATNMKLKRGEKAELHSVTKTLRRHRCRYTCAPVVSRDR